MKMKFLLVMKVKMWCVHIIERSTTNSTIPATEFTIKHFSTKEKAENYKEQEYKKFLLSNNLIGEEYERELWDHYDCGVMYTPPKSFEASVFEVVIEE